MLGDGNASKFHAYYNLETSNQELEGEQPKEHKDEEASPENCFEEGKIDVEIYVKIVDELLGTGQERGLQHEEFPLKREKAKEEEDINNKGVELDQKVEESENPT